MIPSSVITQRAASGAAWLDKVCPNWFRNIVCAHLYLGGSSCCILGQLSNRALTPSYVSTRVATSQDCVVEFGFGRPPMDDATATIYWNVLTEAWLAEIRKREAAHVE